MISMLGGSVFLMWLGEQITERGIGNGISLLIFASIITSLPLALGQLFDGVRVGTYSPVFCCRYFIGFGGAFGRRGFYGTRAKTSVD